MTSEWRTYAIEDLAARLPLSPVIERERLGELMRLVWENLLREMLRLGFIFYSQSPKGGYNVMTDAGSGYISIVRAARGSQEAAWIKVAGSPPQAVQSILQIIRSFVESLDLE